MQSRHFSLVVLLMALISIGAEIVMPHAQIFSSSLPSGKKGQTSQEAPPPQFQGESTQVQNALSLPMPQLTDVSGFERPTLITQTVALVLMSLMPFIIMILTSFMKIVVVLSLLRNALGVQQAPPNQVLNGVAFLLSIYIMFPTGLKMYQAAETVMNNKAVPVDLVSGDSALYFLEVAKAAREPMRDFLRNNSYTKHQKQFYKIIYRLVPQEFKQTIKTDDFIVLVPSFITSQLKASFEIGVLIYIPFFVIDLVTSNILLAMGMMMLSPVTISMPLKLFLLVMLDGWTSLIEGLVSTFR